MNESLCAHCKNCEEVKYDGFFCDCTGYIEDKTLSDGCVMFEDDGFIMPETANKIDTKRDDFDGDTLSFVPVPKTFEEEYKMVEAFFDKYESLIRSAPRNSMLGMLNDLDDAFLNIEGVIGDRDEGLLPSNERALKQSKEAITHVALILAQMWSDENQDIELVCTDPATGEELSVTVPPFDSETQLVVDRMKEIGESMVNKNEEEKEND